MLNISDAEKVIKCGMLSDIYPSISSTLRGRDLASVLDRLSRVKYVDTEEGEWPVRIGVGEALAATSSSLGLTGGETCTGCMQHMYKGKMKIM